MSMLTLLGTLWVISLAVTATALVAVVGAQALSQGLRRLVAARRSARPVGDLVLTGETAKAL